MYIAEYGKDRDSVTVMLHGTNVVHCFGRQYSLAQRYDSIGSYSLGFGGEADRVFDVDVYVSEPEG